MTAKISVEVSNLTVSFGNFKAVDDISFSVYAGEIFGFLGANGAGKTTTIRALCGLATASCGRIKVGGADPGQDVNAVKSRIGYMSQKFTLYQDLTVMENLSFAADLRKIPPEIFNQRVAELSRFIGFNFPPNTLVRKLSGGTKQQVALIACMLHGPEIIFLDEPTAGVSPYSRHIFWELIKKLAQSGKTIFVTTHYMDEAEQCSRIALMQDGKIIALDSPQNLKKIAPTLEDVFIKLVSRP
ncbi:MAG: ABC transporter ATP-binding protein [Elusimicrobia bacterium]|nr:ABC transporter ATP-binding protein [Elusimicrobiota bacterium]